MGLVATGCGATPVTAQDGAATTAATQAGDAAPDPGSSEPDQEQTPEAQPTEIQTAEDQSIEAPTSEVVPTPTPTPHPIAMADTDLPQANIGFDSLFAQAPAGPQPVSIEIEDINVADAEIIPVGVNQEDLSFEVPPADQVGWYEFGSAPGEQGSAVLAAHIAYNGVDGVFRYLEDVEIGAVVVVGFDDGSSSRYRIEEVTEYVKEELPDSLFARDGKEQLALITCGGAFNYQLDSYESNTVAIAVPI